MNVLIIDNSIAFTGAFRCALNEADLLSEQHRFVFVSPLNSTVSPILSEKGYTTYSLRLKEISRSPAALLRYPWFLIKNVVGLRKIIRREKIEVVQVNDYYNLLGALLKISGYRGKLITYVRFLPSAMPAALHKIWIGLAHRYSDYVVAVSDAVLRQLPPSAKNLRIYDPVKIEERYSAQTKPKSGKKTLLYLANFTRGKGQQHAIAAYAEAYQQNKDLRLKFVGGDMGLSKNKAFRTELQQTVSELGLRDVVVFENFTADVEKEIKNAYLLLNFSEAESFSLTCLEATFYGTPVIATKCGGPEEIIQHNTTGYLVNKMDIQGMTAAILELAADVEKRNAFSIAGQQYVREKFSIESFQKSFAKILS